MGDGGARVRVAQCRAAADDPSLGRRAVRARGDVPLDARAELAHDLLGPVGAGDHVLREPQVPAHRLVCGHDAPRPVRREAVRDRPGARQRGRQDRFRDGCRRTDARDRLRFAASAGRKESRVRRAIAASRALAAVTAAQAAAVAPADFAFGMKVIAQGDAAGYRVSLPLPVYQQVVHANLSAVRVFNGRGEVVPFAIERPSAHAARLPSGPPTSLPVFTLRGDPSLALDAVKVTLATGNTTVSVAGPGTAPDAGQIRSYLIDARTLDRPVSALQLGWSDDAMDFAGRLRVEASDDLDAWRAVASAVPIANLHAGDAKL